VRLVVRGDPEAVSFLVEDDGIGMAPDVLARAGEPFFTTKGPNAGMGLGVFLARGVAESLGGALALESVQGRGTTVTLRVPRAPGRPRTAGGAP
jgi:two-component system sensor histidine kinase RegB